MDLEPNLVESMSSTNDSSAYPFLLGTVDVAETDASLPRRLEKEENQVKIESVVRMTLRFAPAIILLHVQTRLPWKS